MGGQKVVKKAITAAELIKALQGGSITIAQAQQMYNGVIPIGDLNGIAALYDINKQVIQPLIWAEKQWTEDIVDGRNGFVAVTIPVGTGQGITIPGEIEVPAGEVWYINGATIVVHENAALTAGDFSVNFLVSSFPKTIAGTDKAYLEPVRAVIATQAVLVGADVDLIVNFLQLGELGTELRLVGGDVVTLVVTVIVGPTTGVGGAIIADLTLNGRVGKLLVA